MGDILPQARRPSLVRTITASIAATSLLALLLQLAIVATRSYFDEQNLVVSYVTHGVDRVKSQLTAKGGTILLKTGRIPSQYRHDLTSAYAFRVFTPDGRSIASHNGDWFTAWSPWAANAANTQDLWLINLDPDRRLHVAGGRRISISGRTVMIEVATRGDPRNTSLSILAAEIIDDVWMPMIPLIVLTLGVAIFSVRRALHPLAEMAILAQQSTLPMAELRIERTKLPQEIAGFVTAINGLLARVQELMQAQSTLVARVAHELRTPLAAMMLEVERVGGTGTVKLESDIHAMSGMIQRLLTLARLELREATGPEDIDLEALAEDMIAHFEPIVAASGHTITLEVHPPVTVQGDGDAIYHALRNLIENAIHHTPRGTIIAVTVGPQCSVSVADNGPGWGHLDKDKLLEAFNKGQPSGQGAGLGLSIVKEAAARLSAKLMLDSAESGGARVTMRWQAPARAPLP